MMDTYGDQLSSIAGIIEQAGFSTSIRGENMARFVYAEHSERTVEVYWDNAAFMVELFEEPVAHSVRDYHQDTVEHAARQAVDWLSRFNESELT
jgi:hypothetical protein